MLDIERVGPKKFYTSFQGRIVQSHHRSYIYTIKYNSLVTHTYIISKNCQLTTEALLEYSYCSFRNYKMPLHCEFCSCVLPSRNKLFKHLAIAHPGVATPREGSLEKVGLLIGFDPPTTAVAAEPLGARAVGISDGRALSWQAGDLAFEHGLWRALREMVTGGKPTSSPTPHDGSQEADACRPAGWTRATGTDARRSVYLAQPLGTPLVSELVCLSTPPVADAVAWVRKLNAKLPAHFKVHGRAGVPPSTHAEKDCDLRRYEVLVPIEVLFPELAATEPLPFAAPPAPPSEAALVVEDTMSFQAGWGGPWVVAFRRLKTLLKRFQGRHNWHNLCAGVLPHDAVAMSPKLVHFKHVSLLRVVGGAAGAQGDGAVNSGGTAAAPGGRCFVVLSLQGSCFLRGMPEALVGIAVAALRGWLPELKSELKPELRHGPKPQPKHEARDTGGEDDGDEDRGGEGEVEMSGARAIDAFLNARVVVPADAVDVLAFPTGVASVFVEGRYEHVVTHMLKSVRTEHYR